MSDWTICVVCGTKATGFAVGADGKPEPVCVQCGFTFMFLGEEEEVKPIRWYNKAIALIKGENK